jgi:hypothetical protein
MEENSESSKAAPQMEGVIIIITMIIVIKIIMLAWKALYKAGLFYVSLLFVSEAPHLCS